MIKDCGKYYRVLVIVWGYGGKFLILQTGIEGIMAKKTQQIIKKLLKLEDELTAEE